MLGDCTSCLPVDIIVLIFRCPNATLPAVSHTDLTPPPPSRPQVKSVGQYVKSSKNVKKRQLVMKFARNLLQMRKDDQMQLAVRARSDQRRSSGGCRDWARAGGESSLRSPPLGTVGQAW